MRGRSAPWPWGGITGQAGQGRNGGLAPSALTCWPDTTGGTSGFSVASRPAFFPAFQYLSVWWLSYRKFRSLLAPLALLPPCNASSADSSRGCIALSFGVGVSQPRVTKSTAPFSFDALGGSVAAVASLFVSCVAKLTPPFLCVGALGIHHTLVYLLCY